MRGIQATCVRIFMVFIGVALFALAVVSNTQAATDIPNIVIFVADDLGWADVGYHGSPIKTPHIDRLCKSGIELDRHYVAPMCTPTRTGLLTGRYWSRFGNTIPSNNRVLPWTTMTMASMLKTEGYETALIGKWHLGSKTEWGPRQFGFDRSHGSLAGGVTPWTHLYKRGQFSRTWHRDDELLDEEGHVTDLLTAEAVRFIDQPRDKPFFLYVPYTAVHVPFDEPEEWIKSVSHIDEGRRQYAACTQHMDDSIGRITAALRKRGLADDTLIVFFSDNGGTNGGGIQPYPDTNVTTNTNRIAGNNRPLRGVKTQVYEGGIRVPAFVNWPGRLKPGKMNGPTHVTDWMPTIAAMVGIAPPAETHWDGVNLWPMLDDQADAEKLEERVIYTLGVRGNETAVHRAPWKLIKTKDDKRPPQLFRLAVDPYEKQNVAAQHPEVVKQLQGLAQAEAAKDNDALPDPKRARAQ